MMPAVYHTIAKARDVAEALYPLWKHAAIMEAMGIGTTKYREILSYSPVIVADKLTAEEEKNLKNFIDSCSGIAFPVDKTIATVANPVKPCKKPWKNPYPNSRMMSALEELRNAADKLRDMGYAVEINVQKGEL